MEEEIDWDGLIKQQKINMLKAKNIKQQYGITSEYYDLLVTKQKGLCAVCEKPPHDKYGCSDGLSLSVDMDKNTGVVRGLLCRGCKTAVTFLKADPVIAKSIAQYLKPLLPFEIPSK